MAHFNERSDASRGLRHKAAILASVILLAALVLNSFFGDRGLLHLVAQRQRMEMLRREVETLKIENAQLIREITDLRDNPRAIESIAREQLGLAKADEIVFIIPDSAPLDATR
jgi:cell division protein FtsB